MIGISIRMYWNTLDNDFIIDIPGKLLIEKITKHKDFCLITTHNPDYGLYIWKEKI